MESERGSSSKHNGDNVRVEEMSWKATDLAEKKFKEQTVIQMSKLERMLSAPGGNLRQQWNTNPHELCWDLFVD